MKDALLGFGAVVVPLNALILEYRHSLGQRALIQTALVAVGIVCLIVGAGMKRRSPSTLS